jgi:small subunit ribosomal protein S4
MLKGDRCRSEKCAFERRPFPPGNRGTKRRKTSSEYNTQLREKQKIRRIYGIMERQFRTYFVKAAKATGVTGTTMLRMLEMRIDNVIYRLGFAPSRIAARQLVRHRHFMVNGKKVSIPSYQVREGDVVQVKDASKNLDVIHNALKSVKETPEWLSIDKVKLSGTVLRSPERHQIPSDIREQLVVELYSK